MNFSSAPPPLGHISLVLNQPSFIAGELIVGTVQVAVQSAFVARSLQASIYGFEQAEFETTTQERNESDGSMAKKVLKHTETREFFRERFVLWASPAGTETMFTAGVVAFSFQYRTADNVPGCFELQQGTLGSGDYVHAKIEYRLDIQFDSSVPSVAASMFAGAKLIVNEKSDREVKPSFVQDSKTFLLTSGKLTCKMWLDHTVYFPGNSIIAQLEVNNTSTKETDSITLELIRVVSLKAHSTVHTIRQSVATSSVKGFEPSWFGRRYVPFRVPVNALPSTTFATLVRCEHMFDLTIQIPRAVDLHVRTKTSILAPQFLFSSAPPAAPPLATVPPEVSFRPPWQPDAAALSCNRCQKAFGVFTWRHHCRNCGLAVCDDCSKQRTKIANLGYDEEQRVCDVCFPEAKAGGVVNVVVPEPVNVIVEPAWTAPVPSAPP
jgi:hypothetical protein